VIRSLKLGLALCCGFPLLLAFGLFSFLTWKNETRQQTNLLVDQSVVAATDVANRFQFTDSVVSPSGLAEKVNAYLSSLAEEPSAFAYLSVLDPFGRVVYHSGDPQAQSVLSQEDRGRVYSIQSARYFPELSEVYVPLTAEQGRIFALVRLGVSSRWRQGLSLGFALRFLPLAVLSILLAVGLSTVLGRRFFARSLAPLLNSVDRVREGDFTRRVDTAFIREELGPLSSSLNRLFETIESDKKQIHRIHSGLTEYKKALSSAQSESGERQLDLEQRVSELEQRFQTLLKLVWQGAVIFDETGRVLAANAELRRMVRLEREGKQWYVPGRIQRMIAKLFVSSSTERVEGGFELQDEVFESKTRYRFRAQRLPSPGGHQQVLLVLEDSTRVDRVRRERADLGDLLRHSLSPVAQELEEDLEKLIPQIRNSLDAEGSELLEQVACRAEYLWAIVNDFLYWDRKVRQTEHPAAEPVDLTALLQGIPERRLGVFSQNVHLHVPETMQSINGAMEEYQRLFQELYTLLQLAAPGPQDSAVDLLSRSRESICILFRKSVAEAGSWTPTPWLERFAAGSPLGLDSWIGLKVNIVRLITSRYGFELSVDLPDSQSGRGLAFTVEIPAKQPNKSGDSTVDDLIKRFFIASV